MMLNAIPVSDEAFTKANALAKRLGISTTELIDRALDRFPLREDEMDPLRAESLRRLNAAYAEPGTAQEDAAFQQRAARHAAERQTW